MNTESYILIKGVSGDKLPAAVQAMSNLYEAVDYSHGIEIFKSKKEQDTFLINFSNIPDFERFKYFVNYLFYPEIDNYKAVVRGYWTIKKEDDLLSDHIDQRVMLYVSETDKEVDNVLAVFNGKDSTVKLGFVRGKEYTALNNVEFDFEEIKPEDSEYELLKSISPEPGAVKKAGKGCMLMLTILTILLVSMASFNYNESENNVQLHRYIPSECNGDLDPESLIDRVISKTLIGDSLFLTLGLQEPCCFQFNPAISFQNNTLNVEIDDTAPEVHNGIIENPDCSCECCFELTLVLTGIKDTSFFVSVEGVSIPHTQVPYKVYPIKYEIYENDTVNKLNKYGMREGVWLEFDDSTSLLKYKHFFEGKRSIQKALWIETYSINGTLERKKGKDTTWTFNENENLVEMSVKRKRRYTTWYENTTYYTNGNINSLCIPKEIKEDNINFEMDSCRFWNENGKEI